MSGWVGTLAHRHEVKEKPISICRGEGGWVEAGWAFMVARGWWGCCLFIKEPASAGIQRRATMKAPLPSFTALAPTDRSAFCLPPWLLHPLISCV